MTELGDFNIRCIRNAHKQLAHVLCWPVGYEAKYYLRHHEVVARVVGRKRNRPVCDVVYWCQPPNVERLNQTENWIHI